MKVDRSRLVSGLFLGLFALTLGGTLEAGPVRTVASGACAGPCFDQISLPRNDDGSSATAEPIGFPINFFGQTFTTTFVNNNGNITPEAPLGTFTPFPLTATATKIIAPYFADVDTRNALSGVTRYGPGLVNGLPAWGVTWIDVGYYSQKIDKKNSFQLVLINMAPVTGVAGDFDIEFNYDKIQWETGEASGGVGGLGGNSARVGYSNGTTDPGTFLELPGSAQNGAFLDGNQSTGLIRRSIPTGSVPLGRYTFQVRNGHPVVADLRVTGTDTPDPWTSGPLTYNFTVDHLGDGDPNTVSDPAANGIRLLDTLPANLTFVSVAPLGTCTYATANRTVTCNVGTLSPGGSFTATVVTQPTAPGGTFLVNTGIVTSNEADPDPTNNSFTVRTNPNDPDASISACNPSANPPGVTEGAACTFTVSISTSSPLAITVNYAVGSGGTAVPGLDYTAVSGTVTFPAGTTQLTRTFNVTTINDTLDEDPETFAMTLTSAQNANLSPNQPTTAFGQINDNDNPPSVKISDCVVVEGDIGQIACDLTVGLFNGATPATSGKTIGVDYLVSDGSATILDSDYVPESVSGTLAFTPGKQSLIVRVFAVGDANVEGHETFNVALSNLLNLCTTGCAHDLNGVGTIQNDDGAALTFADVTVTEPPNTGGTVNATYTLTLTPASPNTVVVTYFTTPITAAGNVDYTTVTNGSVTFTPGQTTRTFAIVVRHDLIDEPTETYLVTLNPATFASIPDPVVVGSILDNDGANTTARPVELTHGAQALYDLAAPDVTSPDVDWFTLAQAPYSSYEVVVDAVSGDLAEDAVPLRVRRLAADQISVLLPDALPVGMGRARTLRWMNGATQDNTQWIRIESGASGVACDVSCGPDDVYRVRFYDTTATVPRFNNSGGQITVLILQNLLDVPVTATAYFWGTDGVLRGSQVLNLTARQSTALNTSTVAGVSGQSGAITIAHTAGYGGLTGKTVALDPANGFSFDAPMTYRPR
jgi:hypothetical protein